MVDLVDMAGTFSLFTAVVCAFLLILIPTFHAPFIVKFAFGAFLAATAATKAVMGVSFLFGGQSLYHGPVWYEFVTVSVMGLQALTVNMILGMALYWLRERLPGSSGNIDHGRDYARDTARDYARDPGRDLERDTERDEGRDAERDVERDPDRDTERDRKRDAG